MENNNLNSEDMEQFKKEQKDFELTYFNTNIENYISNNIPDYLINKYNYVKEKLKQKEVED